jgi:hypothetical protein
MADRRSAFDRRCRGHGASAALLTTLNYSITEAWEQRTAEIMEVVNNDSQRSARPMTVMCVALIRKAGGRRSRAVILRC